MTALLKITHLKCERAFNLLSGFFMLRFNGLRYKDDECTKAWNELKEELKKNDFSTWDSNYLWQDGKRGGWFVSASFLLRLEDQFVNFRFMLEKAQEQAEKEKQEEQDEEEFIRRAREQAEERFRQQWNSSSCGTGRTTSNFPLDIRKALAALNLPVNSTPSQDELKDQYQLLVKRYHPDLTGEDDIRIKQINNANDLVRSWFHL